MIVERVADVAVLIPVRNEADSITRCLEHVVAQDIGPGRIEVIIVDGDSEDDTGALAAAVLERSAVARWVIHRNPGGSTPSNLNAGLAFAEAPIVCRVDARSLIPTDYLRRCLEILTTRPDVAVVGGAQVAVARSGSFRDLGIARALNNHFGMGLSRYRRGASSGPADTVYLGAFRTFQLRATSGWDSRFLTNQDFELNRRLARNGLVWFEGGLRVQYLPRSSLGELWQQYRRFGSWKVTYWRSTGDRPRPRQLLLLAAPLVAVGLWARALFRTRGVVRGLVASAPLAGFLTLDTCGSDEPASSPREVLFSTSASGVVALGWWSGVLQELVAKRSDGR